MKKMRRILSGWLVVCMVISMLPVRVFATENTAAEAALGAAEVVETTGFAAVETAPVTEAATEVSETIGVAETAFTEAAEDLAATETGEDVPAETEAVVSVPAETTAATEAGENVPAETAAATEVVETESAVTEEEIPEETENGEILDAVNNAPVAASEDGAGQGDPGQYAGKVISVLGDSISTFAGYIPTADGFNLEHLSRYPDTGRIPDVTDVNQTWWMQVINELDAKLGINDSWRGATLSGAAPVSTGTTGENAAMSNLVRIQNLGANGTPDIILLYGGTNDLGHVSKVGSFDAASAPTAVDLTTTKWDNLADGFLHTILRIQYYYPEAEIVALLPAVTTSYYTNAKLAEGNAVMAQICEHYGVAYTDLQVCGITTADLPDGIHPSAAGMDYITEAVLDVLLSQVELEAGEHMVYSVTHKLTSAEASLGYYKGISAGKAFEEIITGEDLTVTVTMGGQDITASAYADGKVSIASVTGDVVITAKAVFSLGEKLLTLPESYCAGTNLWTALEHDPEYYTVSGWGVHSSGKVYSVTIPVEPGDRLYATSFGKAGENGGSGNGIRVTYFSTEGMLKSLTTNETYTEFSANGFLTAPEGANAVCVPMWTNEDSNELYLLNAEHSYENGKCTGCGAEEETAKNLSLRYDDHYDISGKTVEIVDAGTPTSWQVGYGIAEGTLDTAVVTVESDDLVATGIGTAMVRIDGTLYAVEVTAAPISLLLLAGQSNMQGIDGAPAESIVCADGMVYATYADRYQKTVEDVTKFAPSALTGQYSTVNVTGDSSCLENYPVNMLTDAGNGREGMDSGIAYEWVKQTGEKVWVINLGYGGSSINGWLAGGEHYEACLELFGACQETLRKEIAAGHFTLSHMGYFWCQGCADETQTAQWYADKFQTMHGLLKETMAFDQDTTFEFAGIIPIRAGHSWMSSYREGVYTDTTEVSYYQSFKDLRFNGPRVAQYWMGNNPELQDIWNVCTIQEGWATLPDGSDGVADYFRSAYKNGTVDYTTQVQQSEAWYTPTTPADVHDNIHYNQIGYNELGREAARNALILMGETDKPEEAASVSFMSWDGFTPVTEIAASMSGNSGTLVVPMVSPVWRSKDVTYTVSEGLSYEYYDLLAAYPYATGTLSANGAAEGEVSVTKMRDLAAFRWVFDGSGLVSAPNDTEMENALSLLDGSVTDGMFDGIRYQAEEGILLLHDKEWNMEIQISDWTGSKGIMVLGSSQISRDGQPYVYFRPADYFVGIGYYDGTKYHNHGISLKKKGIACGEGTHVYRFDNRVAEDGSNMIYLSVDGAEIGALSDLYFDSTYTESDNDWLSGKDLVLPYLGTSTAPITGCTIDSIAVNEVGAHTHRYESVVTAPSCTEKGYTTYTCACGDSYVDTEVEALGHDYVDGFCTVCNSPEKNLWSGRSAVFVGDSITAGTGTDKIYYEYLEESLELQSVTAMGVAGSCISAASDYGQNNQPLISRYQNIPSGDLIVVFMGTNDYGHETPLGSVEDTQDGTFYGALNTIVPALVQAHPSSKIVFVTPLHRYGFGSSQILGTQFTSDDIPNGVGAALGDYVEAVKTVCGNNGVSVIDLYEECTLDPANSAVREEYMPDGLHPNADGHGVIAGIMEAHIREYVPAEEEPVPETELVYGNKFASGYTQQNRASARLNRYLKAGTVITLKDPATFQWACAKTSAENSTDNLGYFPEGTWTDKESAVVEEDGWVGFVFKYRDESQSFDLSKMLSDFITIEETHTHSYTAAVTAPSCTEKGYTTYTCACGDSYVDTEVEALGHCYADGVCNRCGDKNGEAGGMVLTLTPENYLTVSHPETEKLSCAPGLVAYGDGKFAVSYLADEVNSVETEASTTIVCRLALSSLENPEEGTFYDIAAVGQTIGDVTVGSKAPYEPNLLKRSDTELLVLFNIRTTGGKYVYYGATFDTVTNTVTSYQPLTLDGREWTPGNIAASYNAIADNTISTSGPAGSMVFTSQILEHEGYYYGYCGGICSGFSGILVRSVDGIHWTSVMAPEALEEMKGVIECGFQILDDTVYFCMRDISEGVYHCSYRFSTKEQLVQTSKIDGLTTSKPCAFIQDGRMYVIVNKATGDDNSVGRRNTAQFYEVDPETCRLSLARQVFCADGCAYHTVENFNGTNYWCFHTDARRIDPYTQGRSNLALVRMPTLFERKTGNNNSVLDLDAYDYMYSRGCITTAANIWQTGAGVPNMNYQIPLADFAEYDTVTITANSKNKCYTALFDSLMTKAGAVDYAEGWTEQVIMEPGMSQTFRIPEGAQYLYLLVNNAAGDDLLPESVVFSKSSEHSHTYESVVTAPTYTDQGYTTHTCTVCGESFVDSYTAVRPFKILLIGNSHTADYSDFFSNILADLKNAGMETEIVVGRSTIGSIGLYSGRNSNANAIYRSHLEALNAKTGAYNSLKNSSYDLVVVQDYLESVVDSPEVFAAGLASFVEKVKAIAVENGQTEPAVAWFADWVDIRTTGGDSALYDGNGQKIKLDVLSREEVYQKSLACITAVEKAISQGAANMPDFVIRGSTMKQNAMSSYLGTTRLWDKDKYCLLERDTTHMTYELGRYLMGAAVMQEIISYYGSSFKLGSTGTDVGAALNIANGPAASGTGSQYEGEINEEILAIIREAISSPDKFRQSAYTTDPIDAVVEQLAALTLNADDAADQQTVLAAVQKQIDAAIGDKVDAYTVDITEFESADAFAVNVYLRRGYSIKQIELTKHTHSYESVVTQPTCTEKGYTTYTCACGESYVDDHTEATGVHSYTAGVCDGCGKSILGTDWIAPEFAEGDYTMVVLPDTQILVNYWPENYYDQMQWIADSKEKLNILAVMHMGDMVNNNSDQEWTVAEKGTEILDKAGIAWMPMRGNHDNSTYFNRYYDYATYGTGREWFGGSYEAGKLDHCYWFVTAGEREYMILSLGWAPSWDVLAWAQGIVEENPDKNVILNCHAYMNSDGKLHSSCVSSYLPGYPDGDDVWEAFKKYDNVVLAMGGHVHCEDVITYTDKNGAGRDVASMLFDRQSDDVEQRLGMIGLLTFHEDSDTVDVNWYSTRYDALFREKNQFTIGVPHVCDHEYETSTKEANCTEEGGTVYTCKLCGKTYLTDVIPAKGHDFKGTVTAPTCTEKGYTTHTCSGCGTNFVDSEVAALGHREIIDKAVAATCTATGLTEGKHCSVCEIVLVKQEVVPATGHSYGEWTESKAATCTEKGEERRECLNCDDFESQEIAALGHTEVIDKTVAATCTATGLTEGKHCSVCETVLVKQEVVPATGHSYGEWTESKAATCTEKGEERRECLNCDDFETREIAALGHTEVVDKAVAATCTETGLTEGKHCERCGETLVAQERVEALGHSYEAVITEPTCGEKGYTTHTCAVCGDSFVDEAVDATGEHTYLDWKDTDCEICGYVREIRIETTPMYRLYNPNSGEHFYTGSVEERDNLTEAGWNYEGVAWNAPIYEGDPVYRVYNPNSGDHHYTMSWEEIEMLVELGWQYENVAWNSASSDDLPLYRMYNPNADCGSHHYTGSEEERDNLVEVGWHYEGIGWYGMLK